MKVFRAEIHGNRIELRKGDWGSQTVLLNGRPVSVKPFAGWSSESHFLDIQDDNDTTHHIEVRLFDQSKWGMGDHRVVISVNGSERCRLEPFDPDRLNDKCVNCGYRLVGLPVESDEIRCPECGRHTATAMLDLPEMDGASEDAREERTPGAD